MLSIERVSKRFRAGNFGVRDLSLEVKSGVIGLLGPNGAGKTTLMQMIATITRPTSGRILFHGEDVVKRPNRLRVPIPCCCCRSAAPWLDGCETSRKAGWRRYGRGHSA